MKESVDLMGWTNERFDEEYILIKQKKSNLSASQRARILDLMPPERRQFLDEKARQGFITGGEWWNVSKDIK